MKWQIYHYKYQPGRGGQASYRTGTIPGILIFILFSGITLCISVFFFLLMLMAGAVLLAKTLVTMVLPPWKKSTVSVLRHPQKSTKNSAFMEGEYILLNQDEDEE